MQENQSQATERVNLLNFDVEGIKAWCAELGEKPYRAIQLARWMHRHCEDDFDAMSNLAKSFRAKLHDLAYIKAPPVITVKHSADGTRKWLFDVGNGNAVEAVFIPEDDRGTLCISTQAGCAMGCLFCSTGKQGFNRNLTTAEIVGQLWHAERTLRAEAGVTDPNDRIISNVVLMGMGEPLQNLSNVIPALRLFLDDNGYCLSRRRVTVSTSGLVNQIDKLGAEVPVALAVSLHAPDDALRDIIMPVNKNLWSSSFTCVVSGYSLGMTALFYYLIDVCGYKQWTFVFRVIGLNSITIYMAQRIIPLRYASDFFVGGLASKCSETVGAVIYDIGYIVLCWLFLYFLHRKNTFLKV